MPPADDVAEIRAFFAPRAATWDERFPDDGPAFAGAVDAMGLRAGAAALDVGCGTGRALPHLQRAVEPGGIAVGLDLTVEMCAVARSRGPVIASHAGQLPMPDASLDAVFAAGLLHHLADPHAGLVELARVTRPTGVLALFHPIGRAALAARRGHELRADDIRDPANLPGALAAAGWDLVSLDDGDERYLAVATRR